MISRQTKEKCFSKKWFMQYYWIILAALHIIFSFAYERKLFIWDEGTDIFWSIPLSDRYSSEFEIGMTYFISKAMSVIMIILFWKLIQVIFEGKIPKKTLVIFLVAFLGMAGIGVVSFPNNIIGNGGSDSMITFVYSLRFLPFYWQSIYSGCFFSACFMCLPTYFAIPIIQALGVTVTLGYIYNMLDKKYKEGVAGFSKYSVFVMLLFTAFYECFTDPWRCCVFADALLLYIAILVETALYRDKISVTRYLLIVFIGAFLSAFRTEGILYCFGGFLGILLFKGLLKKKLTYVWILLFVVFYLVMNKPSSIGNEKYYGNDYLKVCFVIPLSNILNDHDVNLDYEGAEQDISNIEKVVSTDILRQDDYFGYLSSNYGKGFTDINQTGADKKTSDEFVSSAVRIIMHNPAVFLKSKMKMWLDAFSYENSITFDEYEGEMVQYTRFPTVMWSEAKEDMLAIPVIARWNSWRYRIAAKYRIDLIKDYYCYFFNRTGIRVYSQLLLILLTAVIVVTEIVNCIKGKHKDNVLGWLSLILDGCYVVTILTMPSAFDAYFYPFTFSAFFVIIVFLAEKCDGIHRTKAHLAEA